MQLDSILKQINKRSLEFLNFFGADSIEVSWIKDVMYKASLSAGIPSLKKAGGTFRFARSKELLSHAYDNLQFAEDLENAWRVIQKRGTVKQIVETEYLNAPGTREWMNWNDIKWNDPSLMEEIRSESSERLSQAFNDDDIYGDSKVAEDTEDDIELLTENLAPLAGAFYETGSGVAKDIKWERIKKLWHDYNYSKERRQRLKAEETEPK